MNREFLSKRRYDWMRDPNGYKIIYKSGSYPDPKRCAYCGLTFPKDNGAVSYCGPCSRAMSMGGEEYLGTFNAIVENSRVPVPDKYIDKIDWDRFNTKYIVQILKTEYTLRAIKVKPGESMIEPKDFVLTFEEMLPKVPMLNLTGQSMKATFETADGQPV
jgi:hypothetical protein